MKIEQLQRGAREIPLTQGKVALVDEQDFEELNKFKWHASVNQGGIWYALRMVGSAGKQTKIHMHRHILGTPKGEYTDHADGNGLNNRRENLRIVTTSQNIQNCRKPSNNTSGFKGVSWNKKDKRFRAQIRLNGVNKYLGSFKVAEEAHEAYKRAGKELFGEYFRAE